jgi:hypothetical protein
MIIIYINLTVGLGNTLNLILLLDGIRVGRSLGGIDQLIGQALCDGLDVTERGFTCSSGQEPDSLVHTAKWGHINRLATNNTSASNTGSILTWSSIDNGINKNLDWVLISEQVDDLEAVLDNADSHELLSIVTSVHHQTAGQTLNNWALGLSEASLLITSGSVCSELSILWLHSNIILKGNVIHLDVIKAPLSEQLDFGSSHFVSFQVQVKQTAEQELNQVKAQITLVHQTARRKRKKNQ